MAESRRQVRFAEPDEAYLVAAAIRQHLDGGMPAGVFLVPTRTGPALDMPETALDDPFVRGVIRRFNGRLIPTGR